MKSFLLITIISVVSYFSFSQETKVKKLGYGFFFEGNRSFMEVKTGNEVALKPTFGGGFGILTDYDLTKNFTVVTKLGLSFSNTAINLIFGDDVAQKYKIYPQNIDVRLQANYALGKKTNRPYIFVGPSLMIPLLDRTKSTLMYSSGNTNASIDIGLGFDKDFEIFHFLPEIRYSYGLINVNATPVLRSLFVHRLTLTLNFKN
jgi:hypothetical protein